MLGHECVNLGGFHRYFST